VVLFPANKSPVPGLAFSIALVAVCQEPSVSRHNELREDFAFWRRLIESSGWRESLFVFCANSESLL
jgi:hypothetical protein